MELPPNVIFGPVVALEIDVIPVKAPSTFTLYGSAAVPVPTTVVFLPSFNIVLASFNCFTLTASLSALPSATLVILLPPLLRPALVNVTFVVVPPVGAVIVTPPLVTVVPPTVKEPPLVKSTSLFKEYVYC